MASYNQAFEQYLNRHDAKCPCGEPLWKRIDWAYKTNMDTKRKQPYAPDDNVNGGYILIKYCKGCSDQRKKNYENS